jgi:hypothetical protein
MRTFRALLLVAASATLVGCINSATLITVKPDGSGTVEQTTLVNTGAMKAMMPGMPSQGQGGVVNEADLKRMAERMGKGVRLVSAEPAKSGTFEGSKAIFAFDDINQVQVSQDPSMSGSSDGAFGTAAPAPENPVKFSLKRNGGTSTLSVQFQDKPVPADAKPANMPQGGPDMTDPTVLNMVKTMFDGFKIAIDLQVAGSIVKTNAEHVNGSRITLLEMDLAQLFQDQEKLKALQGKIGPGASLTEVKPYLRDVKGIKIDGPIVNVEFK